MDSMPRVVRPSLRITHGHHIGMSIETKGFIGAFHAPAREKVRGIAAINAGASKARAFQNALQQDQRAAFGGCHSGATHQIGGQLNGVEWRKIWHSITLGNSAQT